MDPSPLRRRTAFGLVVTAFSVLGAYLLGPSMHGATRTDSRQTGHLLGSRPGPARPPAASSPEPSGPNIYQWLPFTQAGLAAAASVAARFGDAYGTFSYTESGSAYAATMQAVTAPELLAQIKAAYTTPGVASARTRAEQVAVGSTTVDSIRGFGPASVTFVVQVSQRLTDRSGHSLGSTSYAVTLTGTGTNWQVSAVELASAGDS
jgi:hypothetical protein